MEFKKGTKTITENNPQLYNGGERMGFKEVKATKKKA